MGTIFKKIIFFIAIISLIISCRDDYNETVAVEYPKDIYYDLLKIPEFSVKEIDPQNGGARQFEIYIKQLLNHNNPDGIKFDQTIYLTYVDYNAPVVFNPNGYAVSPKMKSELSDILNANDIHVGHRYFNGSKPDNLDWQYMTIEQSADDSHYIIELLKPLFNGPWISSGGSKSGVTCLFHRKFFPDDVDATVAYVAPISREPEDPRYKEYINTLGTEEQRNMIKNYQRGLLLRRDQLIPKIDSLMKTINYTFSLTASQILEINAIEYGFSFWQYFQDMNFNEIPGINSTADEYFEYFEENGSTEYYSDPWLDYYKPLYYQVFTELGYCKPDYEFLSDLLVEYPNFSYRIKAPENVEMTFNSKVVDDIVTWLQNEGNNIIYIYGELDPWTAGQIDLSSSTNALKIISKGSDHTVKINDIPEQNQILDSLSSWTGLTIN